VNGNGNREGEMVQRFQGVRFIARDGEEDVFVTTRHHGRYRSLAQGQTVEFDITKGPKGLQAMNVKRQEAAAQQAQ